MAATCSALAGSPSAFTAEPQGKASDDAASVPPTSKPLFVSTWRFGKPVNEAARKVLRDGGSTLDAVEQGIWVAEADKGNGSVGIGGIPNAEGVVQLDACIMWGPGHQAGSVAAIEGILHPISVARRVMEKTPHVMLAGSGAAQFALEEGFPPTELLTEGRRARWESWRAKQPKGQRKGKNPNPVGADNHDTISLLALDQQGNIGGGCSTSGWGYKLPGRVGDSPIIGSGLYVDNEIGAAGATGLGENVMRYCASLLVVEAMGQGMTPEEACVHTIRRIAAKDPKGYALSINFVALDKQGRYGAAGTDRGFSYAVTTDTSSEVLRGLHVRPE